MSYPCLLRPGGVQPHFAARRSADVTGELHGRVVWRELRCARLAAAGELVAALFGWQAAPYGDGLRLCAGERPIAAVRYAAAEGERQPRWLVHFAVEHLEPALERAAHLGGSARSDVEVVAELGRRALIADPQGALCYLVEPAAAAPLQADSATLGDFFWAELACAEPRPALPFYCDLLGWTAAAVPLGDLELLMFTRGGQRVGSAVADQDLAGGGGWISYVTVPDVRACCERARALGAGVYRQPVSLPGRGTFAGIVDPAGARLALWQQS